MAYVVSLLLPVAAKMFLILMQIFRERERRERERIYLQGLMWFVGRITVHFFAFLSTVLFYCVLMVIEFTACHTTCFLLKLFAAKQLCLLCIE